LSLDVALGLLENAVAAAGGAAKTNNAGTKKAAAPKADPDAVAPMPDVNRVSDGELIADIICGERFHESTCSLAARYVGRGIASKTVVEMLRGFLESHAASARDARWKARYADIPRLVETAVAKFQPKMPDDNAKATTNDDWRKWLQKTDKGYRGNLFNARVALGNAVEWRGRLGLNEFSDKLTLRAPPPWHNGGKFTSRQIVDSDYINTALWLQAMGIQVSSSIAAEAIQSVALANSFDPIRGYLDQLAWDGHHGLIRGYVTIWAPRIRPICEPSRPSR
jgi:hypothetical protein